MSENPQMRWAAIPVLFALAALAMPLGAAEQPTLLELGYRQMYNLEFDAAHATFAEHMRSQPDDAMGPVSAAAAYLFAEFDRLHILQSEFFTEDNSFFRRERNLVADPAAKRDFEAALARSDRLASEALRRDPNDENALLATLLRIGLHADYLAFIEKRN